MAKRLFGWSDDKKYRKTRIFGYRKPQEWEKTDQLPQYNFQKPPEKPRTYPPNKKFIS